MNEDGLTVPLALHKVCSSEDLVGQLRTELETERERNWQLARELLQVKQKSTQLEACLCSMMQGSKGLPRVESWSSMASTAADQDEPKVGLYSPHVRQQKIMKYKEKIKKYKERVHISRKFKGRSQIAKVKPRFKGRFMKAQEC